MPRLTRNSVARSRRSASAWRRSRHASPSPRLRRRPFRALVVAGRDPEMGAHAHADHRGRAGRPARVCADRVFPADAGHPQARARDAEVRARAAQVRPQRHRADARADCRSLPGGHHACGCRGDCTLAGRLRRSGRGALDPCHRHRQPEPPDRRRGGLGGSGAGGAGQGVRHACSGARQPHRAVQLADPGERPEAPRTIGLSKPEIVSRGIRSFTRRRRGCLSANGPRG